MVAETPSLLAKQKPRQQADKVDSALNVAAALRRKWLRSTF
jgi:hypothetical protein